MSKSSVLTAYVFLADRKSSFIGSQLLKGLVGLFTALLSTSSEGEPVNPRFKSMKNYNLEHVAKQMITVLRLHRKSSNVVQGGCTSLFHT